MKRRTFVKTVLGALVSFNLIDRQSGDQFGTWGTILNENGSPTNQQIPLDAELVKELRTTYQNRRKLGMECLNSWHDTTILWLDPDYVEIPTKVLL